MSTSVISCAKDIAAVTPADDGDLRSSEGQLPIAIVVTGTAGDVRVTTANGSDIVIPEAAIAVGDRFPLIISRIWATSTTATGIYVMYGAG